jgi:hypothetical protein
MRKTVESYSILMAGFDKAESLEEFKHRLNSLNEKLKRTDKNWDR